MSGIDAATFPHWVSCFPFQIATISYCRTYMRFLRKVRT